MKVLALIPLSIALSAPATVRYVDINCPQPVLPYTDWSTAATNIQDAIDASVDGDFIWVTNGVYATGGKVMVSDLTNRVALDKAITVQSVNGPLVTVIQGAGATNGPNAVRCAWLTNSAVLQGFTLRAGATRNSGTSANFQGGGVWCASSNATVANCLIISNTCIGSGGGGGAYQGTLRNCGLTGNTVFGASAAAFGCLLYNCTVVSNFQGTAINGGAATNCIIYSNPNGNYVSATLAYCCTTPLPSGPGNITSNPLLLADNVHIAITSPCRGAGTNLATGADIDGQPWSNPPSIGCDEWQPDPITLTTPTIQLTSDPVGFTAFVSLAGQDPFTCWWLRNGAPVENDGHFSSAHTTNLVATGVGPLDGGSYQVIVSNAWGMATSAVAQLVFHFVNVASTNPVAPYPDWSTAATTIQDAIDAALPGEVVMVTNGVYATGGKPWGGTLTNRVVVNKALLVQTVNGPAGTIVQGAPDPTATNGPLAIRCVWLTNAAILSGFTLRSGATANSGTADGYGGGVFGSTTNFTRLASSVIANSVIAANTASTGGGANQVVLVNCSVTGNAAVVNGGGAYLCFLRNCVITKNIANQSGGGAYGCTLRNSVVNKNLGFISGGGCSSSSLINCTVFGNTAGTIYRAGSGGGTYMGNSANSIVYANQVTGFPVNSSNYMSTTFTFSCTGPLPGGSGNINTDPQLLPDGFHITPGSPCRGAGSAGLTLATDIDGQPWANPPSMGCDEWWPAPAITGVPQLQAAGVPAALSASAVTAGQPPFACWWFKDGRLLDDGSHYNSSHTTNLMVSNFGPGDAGGYQLIASNAFGMVTTAVAQVVVHCADPAGLSPVFPYSDWSTAATNLQDAVDASNGGEFVLATNGVFNSGGRPVGTGITNRVVISQPMTVISINGPGTTAINGAWDPATTNGPAAIRGVWLADGANLSGFTVQNGATGGDSGGGVYAASTNASIINCVLSNNFGGGCFQGLISNSVLIANQTPNVGGAASESWIINSLVTGNWGTVGGGGTYDCTIINSTLSSNSTSVFGGASYEDTIYGSLLTYNSATNGGGGAYNSSLFNCTVTANHCGVFGGGGIYGGSARNSIIYFNDTTMSLSFNYTGAGLSYCCTYPLPGGTGNISLNPQLLDGVHIATISPCRGKGSATYASGTDIDGEPWASPPSIGCDEVWEANLTGSLAVNLTPRYITVAQYAEDPLVGQVIGRTSRVTWDFGDGSFITNASYIGYPKVWTNTGDYTVTFTAYNSDNPTGVSTNALVHVVPLVSPLISTFGLSGNTFTLNFNGQAGVSYVIDETTDLTPPVAWNPFWPVVGTGTNTQGFDFGATVPARFYRVRMQPWPPPPP